MGYFTNACRYCNMDDPNCTCQCHFPSIDAHEAHQGTICDSKEYD